MIVNIYIIQYCRNDFTQNPWQPLWIKKKQTKKQTIELQNINEKYSTEQTNRAEKEIYDRQLFMNNSFKILNHSDKIYQKKKKKFRLY